MQITPDRWKQIRTVFEKALDRDASQVDGFLDEACDGDPELRRQVQSLLVASDGAGEAIGGAIGVAAEDAGRIADSERSELPERLGRYKILGLLGEGGMGRVLLGERDDATYEQKVAIKVIRRSLATEELVKRFEMERQILADLDSPAVAKLLDGGTTEQGEPFLVMEHVEGRPLDQYCDEENLGLNQRLRLFLQVCRGVSEAHRRLVVHRDLKPSNILVTADGQPKLLDFGIAKLLDPEHAGAGLTRTGLVALTPEYASPEQVLGEPITVASDIYSLGVLLYELLVGDSPYGDASRTPAGLVRAICDEVPERPSTARRRIEALQPKAGPNIRPTRELDWILLQALRKEPERRYASVEDLARDLRAVLTGHPVSAHPDSWSYRTRKWLGRRWPLVAAAALVVAALVAGIVLRTQEAERANRAAAEASELSDFLRSLFDGANPYKSQNMSRETTARDLIDIGAERVRTELAGQPRLQARMAEILAEVYLDLSLPEDAEPMLELAGDRWQELPDDVAALRLNLLLRGRVAMDLGRVEEAGALHRRSVEAARLAHGPGSRDEASSMIEVASVEIELREYSNARETLDGAVAIAQSLDPPDAELLALAYANLGRIGRFESDLETAQRDLEEALRWIRISAGELHPDTAAILGLLGSVAAGQHEWEQAIEFERESLRIARPILGETASIAGKLLRLGVALREHGDLDEAAATLDDGLRVWEGLEGSQRSPTLQALLLSVSGRTLHRMGRSVEGEERLQRAVELAPAHDAPLREYGEVLLALGRPAEAERLFRRELEAVASRGAVAQARANAAIGAALVAQERSEEAESFLREAGSGLDRSQARQAQIADRVDQLLAETAGDE